MSMTVEKLDGNMAKLTIEASAEEFEAALNQAYNKNKAKISVQGFRKGKAPRAIIEKMYGAGVFYEDAANIVIPKAYDEAMDSEEGKAIEVVSQPDIDIVQVEKGKPFIFTALVALKPVVTLGQYKGFDVEKKTAEVTEEEIQEELKKTQERNSRTITVEDRPVQDGDIVNIDYSGFCEGNQFDGGTAEGQDLTIGSHSFVDTFEEQLIGKNIGDETEVNVTFPEQYHSADLAGKPAMFKVKINSIKTKELPELNDEFAEEISDFDTLDEYKKDVAAKLAERKQTDLDNERRDEIVKKVVENAEMVIPDAMIEYQARQIVNDMAQRMSYQGLTMDTYLQYTGQTIEQLVDEQKDQAKTRIQNSLVLEAVAEAEKVEISDEEVEAEIKRMAEAYQMEVDKLKEYMTGNETEQIKKDLAIQKAVEIITA